MIKCIILKNANSMAINLYNTDTDKKTVGISSLNTSDSTRYLINPKFVSKVPESKVESSRVCI